MSSPGGLDAFDRFCAEHPRVRDAALFAALPFMCGIWMFFAAWGAIRPPRERE